MSGVFKVDEPSGPRWELALDLVRRGEAISLGRLTFWPLADDAIEVHVASAWQHQNVTEASARRDLFTRLRRAGHRTTSSWSTLAPKVAPS